LSVCGDVRSLGLGCGDDHGVLAVAAVGAAATSS